MEALQTAQDRVTDVGGGVVELVEDDTAGLGDDFEGGSREWGRVGLTGGPRLGVHEGMEGFAEKDLGGTVVRRGVEAVDAEGDCAGNNVLVWHGLWVVDILLVEGCCAQDEGREHGINRRADGCGFVGHCNGIGCAWFSCF